MPEQTTQPLGYEQEVSGIPMRGYGWSEVLVCPVCGFDYCHVHAPSFEPRDEAWGRRDGYLRIPVEGECGHRWVITINQHKGQEFVTTTRVYDAPAQAIDSGMTEGDA